MNRGVLAYIVARIMQSLLVMWVIVTILFLLFRLGPANPLASYIDTTFTAEQEAALLRRFGLDRPLGEQYVIYVANLLRGDLGDSFQYASKPVTEILADDLPNTLYLTLTSLTIAYLIGVTGGVILAARRGHQLRKGRYHLHLADAIRAAILDRHDRVGVFRLQVTLVPVFGYRRSRHHLYQ